MSVLLRRLEAPLRILVAVCLTGAAVAELTRQPAVMEGLLAMGYPAYLVWILAPAKLAAVAVLLLRPGTDLARAAYVGLLVNLVGACASMLLSGVAPVPDVVIAPAYLVLVALAATAQEAKRTPSVRLAPSV